MNITEFDDLKKNDIVICVNNDNLESRLTLYKKYKVEVDSKYSHIKRIYIINDLNLINIYSLECFETELSYRIIKINKILK